MKRSIAATSLLLVLAAALPGVSAGADEYVGLFSDSAGTVCSADADTGVVTLYIVHVGRAGRGGTRGVRFRIAPGGGFHGVWFGDKIVHGRAKGNTQDGVTINYPECETGTAVIGTVTYRLDGRPLPCSYLEVAPIDDPHSRVPRLATGDCSGKTYPSLGGRFYFNTQGVCLCGIAHLNGEQWKHDLFRAGPESDDVRFAIEGAAVEFDIPTGVLEAVGFVRTRWNNNADDQRFGRRGLMGIPQDGLELAAGLIGEPPQEVVARADANVRAAAALLRTFLDEAGVATSVDDHEIDRAAWTLVLQRYLGGGDPQEVFHFIEKSGITLR